jgi:hypothetical protein
MSTKANAREREGEGAFREDLGRQFNSGGRFRLNARRLSSPM